ncbi:MAG: MotA/TolQ/ExbB proton channel family protein [Candidatus Hydrogenedens sp.]|jgi:biopolymer transport protein ExbB|nr:MotA/TolQ/ExbB proton channel family protein [Candidatus Hydrogenedens sp.]
MFRIFFVFSLLLLAGPVLIWAQPALEIEGAGSQPVVKAADTITLMMMIEQGGVILWIIMGLGFVALVLTLYLLVTVSPRREAPAALVKRALAQIQAGEIQGAYHMCLEREEFLARVLAAGIKLAGHDRFRIQDAMESEGERMAAALWQRITYLNNIAMIAPLLGLLGTVWGMMRAFSAIALDSAQVKGITMAYSVSQAMITTAGGLALAIPAMTIYFLLRGRVLRIIAEVEARSAEFIEVLAEEKEE